MTVTEETNPRLAGVQGRRGDPMTALHIVQPQTLAERIAALQSQARALAGEQVVELDALLLRTAELCSEITACPLRPPGVRHEAARIVEAAYASRATVVSINSRFNR